jgi:gamma-glutamylcyclotransferase (GGCT)/AIG2-like uncharacterized protein YtfP
VSVIFNLFVYGTLRRGDVAEDVLQGCDWLGEATVAGVLYDIDGRFPALLLYGEALVHGELWRCPAALLPELDIYECVADGLFRRVGVQATAGDEDVACWTYAAGPALSRKLVAERRIPSGRWPAGAGQK